MKEKLTSVLSLKNWGTKEKKFIHQCFNILQEKNKEPILTEFIEAIRELENFTIVYDVNADPIYKSRVVKLTEREISLKQNTPAIYKKQYLFRIEHEKYIKDNRGEYRLQLLGRFSNNNISIFRENISTFFHELEHAMQKGFKISSNYAGSSNLMHILFEGDAVAYETEILGNNNNLAIMVNDYFYPKEYHYFKNMEFLLGKNFIKEWKTNSKKDYMKEAFFYFEKTYGTRILEEIIACLLLLEEPEKFSMQNVSFLKEKCQKQITFLKEKLVDLKDYNSEVLKLDDSIKNIELILNNPFFIAEKATEERKSFLENKKFYEKLLIEILQSKGNSEKIKKIIESLKEPYREKVNYEQSVKKIIEEYDAILNDNYLEEKIKQEMIEKLLFLKSNRLSYINRIQRNKERKRNIKEEIEQYQISLIIYDKVLNLLHYRDALSIEETKDFPKWISLKILLLFSGCNLIKIIKSKDYNIAVDYFGILVTSLIITFESEQQTPMKEDCIILKDHLFTLHMSMIEYLYKNNKINEAQYFNFINTLYFKTKRKDQKLEKKR